MLVTLHCPECNRASVHNWRGVCPRCGAYLINGTLLYPKQKATVPPGRRVWILLNDGQWQRLQ